MPDETARYSIWQNHLPLELPLAPNFSIEELAKIDDICGRDIKNAVIDAAVRIARNSQCTIQTQDMIDAINRIKSSRITSPNFSRKLEPEEKAKLGVKLQAALSSK